MHPWMQSLRIERCTNNVVEETCTRCNNVEMWDYAAKCAHAIEMRKEFIKTLLGK